MARTFLVAQNPDPDSRLPYLIRVPVGAGLVLKAKEPWPRTGAVYCHRGDVWPADAAVIEEVPVRSCVKRGPAIDLVLARKRDARSQLVITRRAGREAIFWRTPRTTKQARPGIRVPGRRAAGLKGWTILVDTRERYGYRFAKHEVVTERRALHAGDYAVELDGEIVAAVERKTIEDLAKTLVDGSLAFAIAELAASERAAVAVEGRYSALFKLEHVQPGWVPELLARMQARYPSVPIVFCETRPLAEEWTYRFLGAALAEATSGMEIGEVAEEPSDYVW